MKYLVSESDSGKRIDKLLSEITEESVGRNQIKNLIQNGAVKIEKKKITKPSFLVAANTTIVVHLPEKEERPLPQAEDIPLAIVFENDDFLVISKPEGMCTHPDDHHNSGTVVNAVMGYLKNHQKNFEDDPIRPGIVHRLDKDTSGCLMIAKTKAMQRYLSKIIADRKIEKKYIALVSGRLPTQKGSIDSPLDRDPNNREKRKAVKTNTSKEALTHFTVLEEFQNPTCTLVEVEIITGRTHQIRAHFSAIGHPVMGDILYGNETENEEFFKAHQTNRMFLHAKSLKIPLPNGEEVFVESELPQSLQTISRNLSASR